MNAQTLTKEQEIERAYEQHNKASAEQAKQEREQAWAKAEREQANGQ